MNNRHIGFSLATVMMFLQGAFGQGFVNLNFEQATITPTPVGGSTFPADPAQAFPGWIVGGSNTSVMYNDMSIGGPAVSLMGPAFPNFVNYTPLQGSYSVLLYYFSAFGVPTLSQTGQVPTTAKSINFLVEPGESAAVVTLNGVPIPLAPIAGGRLAGDVSAFAGAIAQLTFSVPNVPGYPGQLLYFDDVRFSSSPAPEPGQGNLLILGVLLVWRCEEAQRARWSGRRESGTIPNRTPLPRRH
jgi:hypothetical protein